MTQSNCDYDLAGDYMDKNRQCLWDRIAELADAKATTLMRDYSKDSSMYLHGRLLMAVLRGWRHGLKSTLPEDFEPFLSTVSRESDPEFQEYLRLRKKFEK